MVFFHVSTFILQLYPLFADSVFAFWVLTTNLFRVDCFFKDICSIFIDWQRKIC